MERKSLAIGRALHPLTLAFLDPEIEGAYSAERAQTSSRELGRALVVAALLWSVAGAIAVRLSPMNARELVALAALIVVVNLLARGILATRPPPALEQKIGTAVNALAGVVVLAMVEVTHLDRFAAAGLIMIVIFAFFYVRMPFVHACVAVSVPLVSYGAFVAWTGRGGALDLFLLYASTAVSGAAAYTLELRTRQVFSQRLLIAEQQRALVLEKEKSERLLLNVLPAPVVARLREDPQKIAEHFEDVTVLFADLVGFTTLAAEVPPVELVALLDGLFSRFDELAERHGLEKIKTIGDAYMVVGGLPAPVPDHACRVARMGLAMVAALREGTIEGAQRLELRVGIHSGPVVAGVIGRKKLTYDLWGDTVNTASRMESHGVAGRVHVSEAVRRRLEGRFDFEDRGSVSVKGKGEMRTYFLSVSAVDDRR